ncbi:AAA-ATPase [Stenotrophomonas phage Summit]|nr:AAA-ATPase [Stenotrophomonas phage Summit]
MLEYALKANLPLVGVSTDDILNYRAVLAAFSGRNVVDPPANVKLVGKGEAIYVTDNSEYVDPKWYEQLAHAGRCMVVVNPKVTSPLLFDGGLLPTPTPMVAKLVSDMLGKGVDEELFLPPLKGLSLRAVGEIIALTKARVGTVTAPEVRRTRGMTSPAIQGFTPIDTSYDFYDLPKGLSEWLSLNSKYFTKPTHPKLVPRGLLLEGPPGTGKTMAAKAISNEFACPLYRLDIATVLDRYIGQSEARVAKILAMCERESPCVLLIDEVEKLFGDEDSSGVTSRILSQLLWWLSEHQSMVFTVMTTNDASKLPPELHRSGRIDKTLHLPKMKAQEAKVFSLKVLGSLMKNVDMKMQTHMFKSLTAKEYSAAEVTDLVYQEVKRQNWL